MTNPIVRLAAGELLFGYAAAACPASVQDYARDAKRYYDQSAVVQLKNALQQPPNHADARLLLGEIYVKMCDGTNAEKEFARAKKLGVEPARYLCRMRV